MRSYRDNEAHALLARMVHVEFWRPGPEIGQSECVATFIQCGLQEPKIGGREPQIVDLPRIVPSISYGQTIRWEDDPEEWARSLVCSYRTPYLLAEILHDDRSVLERSGERLVVRQHRRS
jgi:hypothetical protein